MWIETCKKNLVNLDNTTCVTYSEDHTGTGHVHFNYKGGGYYKEKMEGDVMLDYISFLKEHVEIIYYDYPSAETEIGNE
jgi:hypothetical protein